MSELLEARAAIADLVHTYARHIRTGNATACTDLFTEDAIFEVREPAGPDGAIGRTRSKLTGHQEIAHYLGRTSDTRVCPLIHNLLITVNGREATSTCVMSSIVWSTGQQIIGEYLDTFRRETFWRFSSRVFTILGNLSIAAPHRPGSDS